MRYRSLGGNTRLPLCPFLQLEIVDNSKNLTLGPLDAIVDSGADYTCIPSRLVADMKYNYDLEEASDFNGGTTTVKLMVILSATLRLLDDNNQELAQFSEISLRLPIIESEEALLGRDVLNRIVVLLDGPAGQIDIG